MNPSDLSSLYVSNLTEDATKPMLYEKFRTAGEIESIRLCKDTTSSRPHFDAYINYQCPGDAKCAIATLNKEVMNGRPIHIRFVQRNVTLPKASEGKILISHLEKSINSVELYNNFSKFGNILLCKVPYDRKGSKGFGFVEFESRTSADRAIKKMNGVLFNGQKAYVSSLKSPKDQNADKAARAKRRAEHQPVCQVFDEAGNDVTPKLLCHPDSLQFEGSIVFLDEIFSGPKPEMISGQTSIPATGVFFMPFSGSVLGSSIKSSQSTIESLIEDIGDKFSERDFPICVPDIDEEEEPVKEDLVEDILTEIIHVVLTETDTISLLDKPSTMVSVDDADAVAIRKKNSSYAEVCRNRMGNDKYVDRSMQTLNGAAKNKHVQTNFVLMVDSATNVTAWDMYNDVIVPEQRQTDGRGDPQMDDSPDAVGDINVSVDSTDSADSITLQLIEEEVFGNVDQLTMLAEKIQNSLLIMERNIVLNIFQPKLAAYRQLPELEAVSEPDRPLEPEMEEQMEEACSPSSPAVEHLWAFSCDLTRGRSVNITAWNKKNADLLAVGYGEFGNGKPGLVCCWSLKNITWPDRVIHCDSIVTSLDFSSNIPCQLAVGMVDGIIAVYNVQNKDNKSCVISSSGCPNKHFAPVWQLRWNQQELRSTRGEKVESLFSVAADGRVCEWFVGNNNLDCTEVIKLKKILNARKKTGGKKTEKKTETLQATLTPGLCFDFHPTDSSIYLVGTWEGLIHRCSISSQHFLDSYKEHLCPVSSVTWSPFSPDLFLSCSSDWTVQLWKQGHVRPVISFTSIRRPVNDVRWSPRWATVFGVVNEDQLEIWDLKSSIFDPIIVEPAAPDVKLTSLLFASQTDCVLVGDSNGQVTVYQLKDLTVGESNLIDVLDGIIRSNRT